ncbi:hypothetical protein KY290_030601 [Solanum tuberosum]|uniref:Uncharacterized protein n=1 Tax=Solanum tuberosum TaxID=4113 RepID=A0ABQ7U8L1_SOLTU|nr:hypothetical protein KY290_030601 [Solanum tuberosum]
MDSEETDSKEDENDISRKPCYLLFLVVLVELEMQKIILGELKASKFAQSRIFKDKILPKEFSYHLRNLLVYLRNEKLKKLPTNVTARNIDVARVLVESTIKEDSSEIDLDTMQILEKIEDLKAQVEERYKSLKYSLSNYEFPAVGGLNFLDSLLRKLNEMLKSESSLDFLMKPHIGILEKEFSSLTSVFRDVEKGQDSQFQSCDWKESRVRFTFSEELSKDKPGISRWDGSEESFPQLETLVIKRCDDLEEIPLSFAVISTLKQIKLIKCENEFLKASAAKIKEDVEENKGNDRIDLIIKD